MTIRCKFCKEEDAIVARSIVTQLEQGIVLSMDDPYGSVDEWDSGDYLDSQSDGFACTNCRKESYQIEMIAEEVEEKEVSKNE